MSGDLPCATFLLGDESVGRKKAEESLVRLVFGDSKPGFNLAAFTAADGAERAVEVARTVPMMANNRVVIIRNMESAGVPLLDALLAYMERPNPTTVLILNGLKHPAAVGGVDRGRRLEAAIKKVGQVSRFKMKDQDPVRFAMAHAERAGVRCDPMAARLLVELVGTDLARVQTEMDKVIAYSHGDPKIDNSSVEAVCSLVAETAIWDLTDAVVRRDQDKALAVAHRMLETGESIHRLLAMIAWQMRQLIAIQDCIRRQINPKDAGIRMPQFKLEAAERALRARPIAVSSMMNQLATANAELHRSRAGDRRVFEGLLLELTH